MVRRGCLVTILSAGQIKQYALNAGFTGQSANTITAIALAESGGNPNATNFVGRDTSYGLTQINAQAHGSIAASAYTTSNPALSYQRYLPAASGDPISVDSSSLTFAPPGSGSDPIPGTDFLSGGGGVVTSLDPSAQAFMPNTTSDLTSGLTVPTGADSSTSLTGSVADLSNAASGIAGLAGLGGSSTAAGTSWFDWFSTTAVDLLVRFGVIILGLVLVAIAAYQFAKEQDIVPSIPTD